MTLYVISCALRDASHDYSLLWSALDRKGAKRAMEAVWLLDSSEGNLGFDRNNLAHAERWRSIVDRGSRRMVGDAFVARSS